MTNKELTMIGENLSKAAMALTELAKSREQESQEMVTKHYQDVVLQSIELKRKDCGGEGVMAQAQVTPEYFRTHKPRLRNSKRINTFWGIDIYRYLCDLWQRDYSERHDYINVCIELGIDSKTGDLNKKATCKQVA